MIWRYAANGHAAGSFAFDASLPLILSSKITLPMKLLFMNKFGFYWGALALALLCACGCDSTPEGQLPTAPVEVTVTYNGKPVEGADVTFINSSGPPPAFGKTDANGKAQLSTYSSGDGATLGDHLVSVVKQEFDKVKQEASQESADYNPSPGASPLPVVKHLLPKKYSLPTTSGLTAKVEKGKNQITLELKD